MRINSISDVTERQPLLVAPIALFLRYKCQKILKIDSGNVNFISLLHLNRCDFGKTNKHFILNIAFLNIGTLQRMIKNIFLVITVYMVYM